MTTHVALLRGVNIAGNKRVAMADLRALFSSLGFQSVATLLQSGNVIFAGGRRAPARLEAMLEQEAQRRLRLETDFFVRTAAEWRAIIDHNPFRTEAKGDPGRTLVLCLKSAPTASRLTALRAKIVGRETVDLRGRELYAVYPDGVGRSRLTIGVIDKALGTRATGRNWNTALRIAAALEG